MATKVTIQPETIEKVLVVRNYGLGNFILALPLIRRCQALFPKAKIKLLVDKRCKQIAALARPDLERHLYDDSTGTWLAEEKPDLALVCYPNADQQLASLLKRHCAITVGHRIGKSAIEPYTVSLRADPAGHEIDLNLELLSALGLEVESSDPTIGLDPRFAEDAKRLLCDRGVVSGYVVLHPGCHPDLKIKRWPVRHYAALARQLLEQSIRTVIVGGMDEIRLGETIARESRWAAVDLTGQTSLPVCAAILAGAGAVMGNDSGLLHLAAAVGAPIVNLFGPTSFEKNFPREQRHIALRAKTACSPCYQPGQPLAPCRGWCLEMIQPATVAEAIRAAATGAPYAPAKKDGPRVSVIVPTRNGGRVIGDCLKGLTAQNYPKDRYEIIVVDNGSEDATKQIASSFEGVRVLSYTERASSYAARNAGIQAARGEIFAFTDDDCVLPADWLKNGVEWFAHPEIGCVAGDVLGYEPKSDVARFQSRNKHLSPSADIEYAPDTCICTANAFYRKAVFEQLGPFNDRMISGGDLEMTNRVRKDGRWAIRYAPYAQAFHRHREKLSDFFRVFVRYGYGHVYQDRFFPRPPYRTLDRVRSVPKVWGPLLAEGVQFVMDGFGPHRQGAQVPVQALESWLAGIGRGEIFAGRGEAERVKYRNSRHRIALHDVPTPPGIDYLGQALCAVIAGCYEGLFLYGAGQHTRRIATLPEFENLPVLGVIDDNAKPGQRCCDKPMMTLDQARERGLKTILISTDAFEKELLKRLTPLRDNGIEVLGLYDEGAMERYGRWLASQSPDSARRALALSTTSLSSSLREALARGLEAEAILEEDPPEKYSDEFLDWVMRVAKRSGRLLGSIRYRHFFP